MVKKLHDFCTIDGCSRAHAARGYCINHYRMFRRHGDPLYAQPLAPLACRIDQCDGPHAFRGLCSRHYRRLMRQGDPTAPMRSKNGASLEFLRRAVGDDHDECVLWPFTQYSNGYGSVWHEGRLWGAHRLACRLRHGEPSDPQLQAAHKCGNKLCINPRHLRWATQAENEQDKLKHGTANRWNSRKPNLERMIP